MKQKYIKNLLLVNILVISVGLITFNVSKLDFLVSRSYQHEISTPSTSDVHYILWETNGTIICNASLHQGDPQICSDGVGGAIITWFDRRGSQYDVYAQRINSTGDAQWVANGTIICTANGIQEDLQICSDGVGGAIITWRDRRDDLGDIYIQRVNSTGDIQWTANGTDICTAGNIQSEPQICSDGVEGAIITWENYRSASEIDIYVQRINSTGDIQWTGNGTIICNASNYQSDPQICSDGVGGAIITWLDERSEEENADIYVQRINSTGDTQWTANGTDICTADNYQYDPQICSDGVGGAIITWADGRGSSYDIYAQRINSTGDIQWTANGTDICKADNNQKYPQICSDGAGGAIITWGDTRSDNDDIYVQRINSIGDAQWTANGTAICTDGDDQSDPQICSDGVEGAIITWWDLRSGGENADIYVQRINSAGDVQWTPNGTAICTADDNQENPQICSDGVGGAIITWRDYRSGTSDIYAQYIKNDFPPSLNHPSPITTSAGGSETIDWTLYDDYGAGQYRVWANNTNGNYYVWINLTPWKNNSLFSVPINRTRPGIYNYTIEYYDDQDQFGIPDTVIITINDAIPTSNHLNDITSSAGGSEIIDWILYDDFGGGQYRVLANDTNGNYYTWVDWTPWTNNTPFSVSINRTAPGIFSYTIEYYDDQDQNGNPDTAIVIIIDEIPISNQPVDITTTVDATETINWILYDDFGGGQYRVLINGTSGQWFAWTNNTALNYIINTSTVGTFNYTIQYYDSNGQFGVSDTVIIIITEPTQQPADIFWFLITSIGIIGAGAAVIIIYRFVFYKKRGKI